MLLKNELILKSIYFSTESTISWILVYWEGQEEFAN